MEFFIPPPDHYQRVWSPNPTGVTSENRAFTAAPARLLESNGAIAQLVERRVRNAKVRGSIPLSSTNSSTKNIPGHITATWDFPHSATSHYASKEYTPKECAPKANCRQLPAVLHPRIGHANPGGNALAEVLRGRLVAAPAQQPSYSLLGTEFF